LLIDPIPPAPAADCLYALYRDALIHSQVDIKDKDDFPAVRIVAHGFSVYLCFNAETCSYCLIFARRAFYKSNREHPAVGCHKPAVDISAPKPIRKVRAREFAEQFFGLIVIGLCGPDLASKETQVLIFTVMCNSDAPFSIFLVERDTLERRKSSHVAPAVCHVLRASAESEVAPSIVQTVVVSMVDFNTLGRVHDLPVHLNGCSAFVDCHVSHGIERIRPFTTFLSAPIEL
jgi:hypothetical protein